MDRVHPRRLVAACAVAAVGFFTFASRADAAPRYALGQTGTFGLPSSEPWNFNTFLGYMDTGTPTNYDEFDVRFTAMETQTVDRVFQRFIGVDSGSTVSVRLLEDDGDGNPSAGDTQLANSGAVNAQEGVNSITFGSATLTAGKVYHIVTKGETINGNGFNIFNATGASPIRAYDRALDPSLNVGRRRRADTVSFPNWTQFTSEPYFALANGSDTNVVGGPSQPYDTVVLGVNAQGNGGLKYGERFKVFDTEVPTGVTLRVKQITFAANYLNLGGNGTNSNLIVRLRDGTGTTILGSATMTLAQMNGTDQLLTLDTPVDLLQGTSYMLTTEVAGGGNGNDIYQLKVFRSLSMTNPGPATWGGIVDCVPVQSTSGASGSYTVTSTPNFDLAFSFQALVPEPAGASLAGAIGVLVSMSSRRGRRNFVQ